uniref:Uncharacterized protein n=1 Tax=viral metagenome TaxID=1070528 RepID=A0A6M3IS60_9ZZZZ
MGTTNTGKAAVAGLINNIGSITAFTYLAYGDDTTAFGATQTALVGTESQRAAATCTRQTTTVTNDTTQWAKTFTISATETIGEVGVFNASSAGIMGWRSVLATPRSVASGDSYVCTYKVAIT